jgi:uncharacterized protein YndB with AHSA1/START domain
MNDAALKPDTQDIVVDEVFPHTPETIWKTLTTANLMGRWLMMPAGFEPVEGKHFTLPDHAGRRVGRHHSLPGAGGEAERTFCLCLERRA